MAPWRVAALLSALAACAASATVSDISSYESGGQQVFKARTDDNSMSLLLRYRLNFESSMTTKPMLQSGDSWTVSLQRTEVPAGALVRYSIVMQTAGGKDRGGVEGMPVVMLAGQARLSISPGLSASC